MHRRKLRHKAWEHVHNSPSHTHNLILHRRIVFNQSPHEGDYSSSCHGVMGADYAIRVSVWTSSRGTEISIPTDLLLRMVKEVRNPNESTNPNTFHLLIWGWDRETHSGSNSKTKVTLSTRIPKNPNTTRMNTTNSLSLKILSQDSSVSSSLCSLEQFGSCLLPGSVHVS